MKAKIYYINFSGRNDDKFYFAATSEQVETIETESPFIVNFSGWNDDQHGRAFVGRINKHLFTYPEIRNKINIYLNWCKN